MSGSIFTPKTSPRGLRDRCESPPCQARLDQKFHHGVGKRLIQFLRQPYGRPPGAALVLDRRQFDRRAAAGKPSGLNADDREGDAGNLDLDIDQGKEILSCRPAGRW